MNKTASIHHTCEFRVLTAAGPGAVAVIELTTESAATVAHILRRIQPGGAQRTESADAAVLRIGRIFYGCWDGEDLVVVRTSDWSWEIQCHGGFIAVDRICRDLRLDGAVEVTASSGASCLSVGRRIDDTIQKRLPYARSRKTAGLLLAQATNSLRHDLTMLHVQAEDSTDAIEVQGRLRKWQSVADHLTKPWRVVLAGAPNVGKSSLLNAIAGMERSIVYDQPGTTRDLVEVDVMIDGWSFRFVDTAGLRGEGDDGIEECGIQLSRLEASKCDVLCLVFDEREESAESIKLLLSVTAAKQTVLVRNKCDLQTIGVETDREMLNVSATTGAGLDKLLQWIRLAVVPEEPNSDTPLPIASWL